MFYFDEKKKYFVERFKDRIIFPINSITGQPIALGGRTIKENNYIAKYINSPETPFFKKGSNLYNLDYARKLSNKVEYIFLVEGYMDVVGLRSKGIENVFANLGTSLTDRQVSILNQFYDDLIICSNTFFSTNTSPNEIITSLTINFFAANKLPSCSCSL